ncbi:hypothetical protein Q5H93_09785 [Hymenobacter sp. ASUV-10]|uniref:F5/8 type C domain-containing protein n=1 Tax=Hymenobacter aranciens TaxID=3063996 RepID=A0ABT9BBF5_9BACT|nr:hypothetical protein [Hymenobacter sp. ASUV-10]MDO7875019.1 hypothetical protein [Hymenobacter sp. ASUV-10]
MLAWQYQGGGQIEWFTMREHNSAFFELQQSFDGRRWRVLGNMEANPGHQGQHGYVYYESKLSQYRVPVLYYRLRQVAQDGSFTYSPVRTIRLATNEALSRGPAPGGAPQ